MGIVAIWDENFSNLFLMKIFLLNKNYHINKNWNVKKI